MPLPEMPLPFQTRWQLYKSTVAIYVGSLLEKFEDIIFKFKQKPILYVVPF